MLVLNTEIRLPLGLLLILNEKSPYIFILTQFLVLISLTQKFSGVLSHSLSL